MRRARANSPAVSERAGTTPKALMKSETRVSATPSRPLTTAGLLIRAATAAPTWGPTAAPRGSPRAVVTCSEMVVAIASRTVGSLVRVRIVAERVWSTAVHTAVSPRNAATASTTAVWMPAWTSVLARNASWTWGHTVVRSPVRAALARVPAAWENAFTTPVVPKKSLMRVSRTPISPVWMTGLVIRVTTAAPIWSPTTEIGPNPRRSLTAVATQSATASWTSLSPSSVTTSDDATPSTSAHTAVLPNSPATAAVTPVATPLSMTASVFNSCTTCGPTSAIVPSSSAVTRVPAASASVGTTPKEPRKSPNAVLTNVVNAPLTVALVTNSTTAAPICGPTTEPRSSPRNPDTADETVWLTRSWICWSASTPGTNWVMNWPRPAVTEEVDSNEVTSPVTATPAPGASAWNNGGWLGNGRGGSVLSGGLRKAT